MKIGSYTLSSARPAIMGIVNVTPDSFSDGGLFLNLHDAIDHALRLLDEGADIIDVGGESTRPGARHTLSDEEVRRVVPVIEGIRRKTSAPISIDTTKASVAKLAVSAGANMINDISAGRFDSEVLPLAASANVPICLMHMQGMPETMQTAPHYDNLLGEIKSFLESAIQRAVSAGMDRSKIIIDPGIGFGKSPRDNVEILKKLKVFSSLGCPVLIGTSRKSFLGKLLNLNVGERTEATLATLAIAVDGGASILRVHDAGPARKFLDAYMLCKSFPDILP